jgi:hypothetical protein
MIYILYGILGFLLGLVIRQSRAYAKVRSQYREEED